LKTTTKANQAKQGIVAVQAEAPSDSNPGDADES